ncbi:hypothetical protein C8R43DRAFT_1116062 [Mycena crocata]|nr:hypothetical protein C8R43DRAFT_1116062 [Mycena crocata]
MCLPVLDAVLMSQRGFRRIHAILLLRIPEMPENRSESMYRRPPSDFFPLSLLIFSPSCFAPCGPCRTSPRCPSIAPTRRIAVRRATFYLFSQLANAFSRRVSRPFRMVEIREIRRSAAAVRLADSTSGPHKTHFKAFPQVQIHKKSPLRAV